MNFLNTNYVYTIPSVKQITNTSTTITNNSRTVQRIEVCGAYPSLKKIAWTMLGLEETRSFLSPTSIDNLLITVWPVGSLCGKSLNVNAGEELYVENILYEGDITQSFACH